MSVMATHSTAAYLQRMSAPRRSLIACLAAAAAAAGDLTAQAAARDSVLRTTGGLSVGVSGVRSNDGTTVTADVMWVGAEMMDGIGVRVIREGLSPRAHGYAAMIIIGGPPHDSLSWARLDFGLGYVGQQSSRSLKLYQRHGLGALFGLTIAPVRLGIVRPELNGWAVAGTSARFLGASLGVRILDPRQR
jgi:hypothetical protein